MKYLLLLALLFPLTTFATSGACSGHGGVNCGAGATTDGNALCIDGTESSVPYSEMDECYSTINCPLPQANGCTNQTEYQQIEQTCQAQQQSQQKQCDQMTELYASEGIQGQQAPCMVSQSCPSADLCQAQISEYQTELQQTQQCLENAQNEQQQTEQLQEQTQQQEVQQQQQFQQTQEAQEQQVVMTVATEACVSIQIENGYSIMNEGTCMQVCDKGYKLSAGSCKKIPSIIEEKSSMRKLTVATTTTPIATITISSSPTSNWYPQMKANVSATTSMVKQSLLQRIIDLLTRFF